jgi:flavin reductase (DIM6/NTAB) family NADH-FMN oxidoreductase RutF
MQPAPVSLSLFRRACGQFATGVVVAAVRDSNGKPHGLTINSFTSVSLTPPLVLICIDHRAAIGEQFRQATHFGLSILNASQRDLSNRFATKPDDRFDGVGWHLDANGVPLLNDALATLTCQTREVLHGGDHAIFLAEVVGLEVHSGEPLLYFNSAYAQIQK